MRMCSEAQRWSLVRGCGCRNARSLPAPQTATRSHCVPLSTLPSPTGRGVGGEGEYLVPSGNGFHGARAANCAGLRSPISTRLRTGSYCGNTRLPARPGSPDVYSSARNWANCSVRPSGADQPGRSSPRRPGRRGPCRISAGRIRDFGTMPACRGIWSCTSLGMNAVRRFAARRESNSPAGYWGTPTFRPRSAT